MVVVSPDSFSCEILLQPGSQLAGLRAHNVIGTGVVACGTTENVQADLLLGNFFGVLLKGLLGHVH